MYWIEAMSIMGLVLEIAATINMLQAALDVSRYIYFRLILCKYLALIARNEEVSL